MLDMVCVGFVFCTTRSLATYPVALFEKMRSPDELINISNVGIVHLFVVCSSVADTIAVMKS